MTSMGYETIIVTRLLEHHMSVADLGEIVDLIENHKFAQDFENQTS
jgi:hypothetical protein